MLNAYIYLFILFFYDITEEIPKDRVLHMWRGLPHSLGLVFGYCLALSRFLNFLAPYPTCHAYTRFLAKSLYKCGQWFARHGTCGLGHIWHKKCGMGIYAPTKEALNSCSLFPLISFDFPIHSLVKLAEHPNNKLLTMHTTFTDEGCLNLIIVFVS
jgi:hypothetical protein